MKLTAEQARALQYRPDPAMGKRAGAALKRFSEAVQASTETALKAAECARRLALALERRKA